MLDFIVHISWELIVIFRSQLSLSEFHLIVMLNFGISNNMSNILFTKLNWKVASFEITSNL